jgi:hypothetical protein
MLPTMKKLTLLFSFFCLLTQACNSNKELSRDDALKQIKQERNYPKVIDFDIYCSDPMFGRKVLDAGLESAGLVTVQRTQKLADAGKPLVTFTQKAQPYLLPTPEKDKAVHAQKVKLAEEDIIEVTNIRTNKQGNKAVVDYTTTFKNITPFVKLTTDDFTTKKTNKAYFGLGDQGWKLERKPDIDFMELEK